MKWQKKQINEDNKQEVISVKLAICAEGEGLKAKVDQRFGRCPYFVIVDTENREKIISIRNSNAEASGGAGPQAAQLLAGLGVDAVALGNVGPNAVAALGAARIEAYSGVVGTVEEVLEQFRAGKLTVISDATVSSHAGMRDNQKT